MSELWKRFVAIYVFAIAAGGIVYVCIIPGSWNNPRSENKIQKGTFRSGTSNFDYSMQCDCPLYLIQGSSASITFSIEIEKTSNEIEDYGFAPRIPSNVGMEGGADAGRTSANAETAAIKDPIALRQGASIVIPVTVKLANVQPDLSDIRVNLIRLDRLSVPGYTLYSFAWPLTSRPTFARFFAPYLYATILILATGGLGYWYYTRQARIKALADERISTASTLANENPTEARFAWDLARIKLEAYFDRNLLQVNLVFWVACVVMAVGFSFVLIGVWFAYAKPDSIKAPLVAAVSGIITQFIGATFMVIYKSTMAQANDFMTVLERINSAGMSVQILDALKDGTDLKDQTRAELAKLLLITKSSVPKQSISKNKGEQPK